jgi:hypothetical protein
MLVLGSPGHDRHQACPMNACQIEDGTLSSLTKVTLLVGQVVGSVFGHLPSSLETEVGLTVVVASKTDVPGIVREYVRPALKNPWRC